MTDLTESPDWALGCMTAILGDMRHDLGIARHMIHSDAAMDMEWARWTDHLDEEHEALTEHHQDHLRGVESTGRTTYDQAWRPFAPSWKPSRRRRPRRGKEEDLATAASMWRMLGAMGDVLTKGVASARGRPAKGPFMNYRFGRAISG